MDVSLYFIEKGTGEPLVLLHGNGESSDYFAGQIGFFASRYRVIAVDTRGHGKSPRGAGPFTLGRFADDLKEFLDARGIMGINLLGFSDGGNTALLFALRYPSYVRRLILNGANLTPSGMKPAVWLAVFLEWCRRSLAAPFSPASARQKEFLSLMLREPHVRPSALSGLDIPVLVVAGSRDMIRRRHTEKIAGSLRQGALVILPGTHFIASENSTAFNEAVLSFLSR